MMIRIAVLATLLISPVASARRVAIDLGVSRIDLDVTLNPSAGRLHETVALSLGDVKAAIEKHALRPLERAFGDCFERVGAPEFESTLRSTPYQHLRRPAACSCADRDRSPEPDLPVEVKDATVGYSSPAWF